MKKIYLSDHILHAVMGVTLVHLVTTMSIIVQVHGHWGWYVSLVLTVWVLTLVASVLCGRADDVALATRIAARKPVTDSPARYR